jgi:hypothetical protein
MTLSPAQFES